MRRPGIILVSVVIFSIYSSISSFASLEAGKAEKVWEAYFQSSDSGVALEAFEKLAARKDAAPAEWLGLASVLDGRERLSEAQSAYTGMLESVWREMLKYSPEKAASLRDLENELVLSDLEQGTPEAIDQAIWLWAMGQVALYSANKIAPYGKDREGYLNLLGAMADAPAPGWTGFQQLQSEARFTLASRLLESGQWERVERLTTDNGFLRDFLWIGPFPNKEEAGYDEVFAPELEFDLSAEYEGLLRSVRWRPLHPAPRWGYVNFQALVEPVENSTVYALTFVYSNRVRPVAVDLGHAGAAKVWVAGRWVIGNDSYHEATPFQVHASAELQGGWNPILVKLCSKESSQFGFYLRLTTPEGRPLVAEKTPPERLRFWSSSDEIPDASGWPVMGGDGEDLHDWNLDTLARLTDPERSPLESTLADWLASAYLDFHSSLDEISTQALDLLRLAEERYPRCGLIQRWIGIVELDENLSRQAYEKAAELDPAEVLALSQLARHYLDKPYKDRALETVEKGLARNPNSPRLWLFKGEALMRQPESAPLARLAFLKGSQLSPGYYYGLYRSIQTEGDALTLDQSIEKLSAALDLDRTVADVRFQLVRALLRAGRAEEAWKTAEEATRADPYDSRGYEILARHFRAASDWEQANAAIEKALDISPEAPGLNALAGEIYHEQGRSEDARAAWQLALTVKPNDPRLEEYLNLLYEDSDDYYRPYRIDLAALPEARSEDYPEASLVVLLDQEVQKVYSNGSSSRTTHLVRKALTDAGVNQMKSHAIYFDPEQERVKIKRARVIRPDGSVFDAPRPTVRSARGGGDSRIYGDYSVQLLSFPAVEKGATVDLEYEVQETGKNIYVDYFGSQFYFGQFDPSLLCEYVLIAPAQRKFYWKMTEPDARYALPEARKVTEFPEDRLSRGNFFLESEGPDERVWAWNYTNRPLIRQEPSMPASSEIVPYLKVSTFSHWGEMTKWYWDLIKDQFQTDEALRRLSKQLIEQYAQKESKPIDQLSDLEVVKALNGYVNTQIRYLGLEFGIHGYKPHRVVDIGNARYGDCKDKAALMVAMASDHGVPGRIALLRTSDRGRIDYELPSLHLFNHAIIYFPDLDGRRFILDGTAQFFGTTELPPDDQGTQLLTIVPGGGYEFVDSPIDGAEANAAYYRTQLTLSSDGSAKGIRRTDFRGLFNPSARSTYQNRGKVKETIEQQFGSAFPGTTAGNIELSDLDDYETPEWIQFGLDIPRFADRPAGQENRLTFRPILFPAEMSRTYAPLPRREHELVLRYNWTRKRSLEVEIPEGYRVAQLPEAQGIETPFGRLSLQCRVEGNRVIAEENSVLRVETLRIPAEQYEAFRDFCARVDRAEEQQVVLERIPQ